VVPALMLLNIGIFAVMIARGVPMMSPGADSVLAWGANYGAKTLAGEWWRLIASTFLHFGAIHVAFNMMALWNGGGLVERIYGSPRFAVLYLVAGVIGSVTSVGTQPHIVSAGASGAVFGIYGALAAFLYRRRGVIPPPVLRNLTRVATTVIVVNVVFGFTQPGIDNAAHLGGLVGGAVSGFFLVLPTHSKAGTRPAARPLLVLAAAIALSATVVRLLPTPSDLMAELEHFTSEEARIIDQYNAFLGRLQKNELGDDDYVAALEGQIVPPWRQARLRLAAQSGWPNRQQKVVTAILRYADMRERGWTDMAKATRLRDMAAMEEAKRTHQEADRLLRGMGSGP
jgi:rhomboid protease GluP